MNAMQDLPEAVAPDHLTMLLRRSGALKDGTVAEVSVESSRETILSRIVRLRLTCAGAASGAPASLILKTGRRGGPGPSWNGGRQEVAFYAEVAPATPPGLLPRCFGANWDASDSSWHLLLEDLTDTHTVATSWPLPPSMEQCGRIIDARARFHAAWWDEPRLGVSIGSWPSTEDLGKHFQDVRQKVGELSSQVDGMIPNGRRDFFARLLDTAPSFFASRRARGNFTIIQGDAHVWNSFLPRDGIPDDVRLFDWDSWRIGLGSTDLAYMMAMHWYPELRRRAEGPLLDRYHAMLLTHGVRGYDRRALDEDYRASVLWLTTLPVIQAAVGIPPLIWWNNLERVFLAVDDLDCLEIIS